MEIGLVVFLFSLGGLSALKYFFPKSPKDFETDKHSIDYILREETANYSVSLRKGKDGPGDEGPIWPRHQEEVVEITEILRKQENNRLILKQKTLQDRLRFYIRILISLVVLGASLFIILNGAYSGESEKWAFGSVGTILGYWLKD